MDLQAVAFGFEEDGSAGTRGVDGDAAQSEPAIARAGAQSRALPARSAAAAGIEPPIAHEGMPGQRETGAAIAEALAELLAQTARPFVGRGMGIAELNDVYLILGGAETHQLFEEGHQRAGLLERLLRRAGEILLHFALRGGARGGTYRRGRGTLFLLLGSGLLLRGGRRLQARQQAAAHQRRSECQGNPPAHHSRKFPSLATAAAHEIPPSVRV